MARRRVGGGAAHATGNPAGTCRTQARRSARADCSALESAANGEVSAVSAFSRAAAPPIAGRAGPVGARRRPSASDCDRDRRLALGRPVDAGAAPTDGRAGATARLLLLYTARPEFRAQWAPRVHHTQITLNR